MRRAGAVLGVLCIVLGVLLYLVRVRPSARAPAALPHAMPPAPRPRPALVEPPAPAWRLGQLHLGVWHVAGRVTFEGRPVPRAGVSLTSDEMGVGDWPLVSITADAAGRFDFGLVPAGRYHVRGESPGRLAGDVVIDLRAPKVSPAPDALEIVLGPCAMRVFGAVRDAAGRPLALARVRATRTWFIYLANAVADAEGNYEVCAPSGTVHLEAWAPGYARQTTHRTDVRELHVDFALRPEVVIAGVVLGSDGASVDGAQVAAETDGHLPGTVTESDGDGRFRLEGLSDVQHYVVVARSGDLAAEKPVPAAPPGKTVEVELRLAARATLGGRVLAAGAVVPGATVIVEESDHGRLFGTALSQADGRFEIAGLPKTRAHVRVRGHRVVEPKVVDLAVVSAPIDIQCERLAVVSGRVVAGGRPAPRVAVTIRPPSNARASYDTTAADGTFRIAGVEPGKVDLLVRSEDGLGVAPTRTLEIGDADVTDLTIELGRGAAVSGTVVRADGTPLPDVIVNVYRDNWRDIGRAQTGVDGTFKIVALLGGAEYRSAVYAPNDAPLQAAGDYPSFQLPAGGEATGVRLVVGGGDLAISGHVFRSGRPVEGVDVTAVGGPGWPAVTDGAGAFTLSGLRPEPYRISFHRRGRYLYDVADVAPGRTDFRIDLPPTGTIEGTLVGFHERPRITLDRGGATEAQVAGDGFVIDEVGLGTYQVTASSPSGDYARATATVSDDQVAKVTLTTASAQVEGVLTRRPYGEPIAGASCQWIPFEPLWPDRPVPVTTDTAGRFAMNVPPGRGGASCHLGGRGVTARAVLVDAPPGAITRIEVSLFVDDEGRRSDPNGLSLDYAMLVTSVAGPFEAAGLIRGDRVLSIDGETLAGVAPNAWGMLLLGHDPEVPVSVRFERGGAQHTVAVKLPPFPGGN